MKNFNWKDRFKNPVFWVNCFLAIAMPIIAYYGMSTKDFTTWGSIFNVVLDALKNPYVLLIPMAFFSQKNTVTITEVGKYFQEFQIAPENLEETLESYVALRKEGMF